MAKSVIVFFMLTIKRETRRASSKFREFAAGPGKKSVHGTHCWSGRLGAGWDDILGSGADGNRLNPNGSNQDFQLTPKLKRSPERSSFLPNF
jgi:hypothetical protein